MCSNDKLLIKSLKCSDKSAFRAIFNKYSDKVYQSAFYLIKDTGWSEDIVQDVFVKLWNYREKLDADKDLLNFLLVITKREVFNKLRGLKRSNLAFNQLYTNISSLNNDVEKSIISKDSLQIIYTVVDDLPKKQKEIYLMNKIEGLSYQEIATALGISISTVRNQLISASKVIKSKLIRADYLIFLFSIFF